MSQGRRGLSARLRAWWGRRRGRHAAALDPFAGPDDDAGGVGVREPRRPRPPHLSGGIALEEPETREE